MYMDVHQHLYINLTYYGTFVGALQTLLHNHQRRKADRIRQPLLQIVHQPHMLMIVTIHDTGVVNYVDISFPVTT
jgi:hypothetical protein